MKEHGIQPNDFRYRLLVGGQEYDLPRAPIGWEDGGIRWQRNREYLGIVRSYSLPIKFVVDGAFLVRRELYSKGIQGRARLIIEILNRETWDYEHLYSGDLDLSTANDLENDIEVALMDSGLAESIKAYENVKFEIELSEADTIPVILPAIDVVGRANHLVVSGGEVRGSFMPFVQIVSENSDPEFVIFQSADIFLGQVTNFFGLTNWFAKAERGMVLTLNLDLQLRFSSISRTPYFLRVMNSRNARLLDIPINNDNMGGVDVKHIQETVDINMQLGDELFIYVAKAFVIENTFMDIEESYVTSTYSSQTESSICRAMRPKVLFNKLIDAVSLNINTVNSRLLDEWDNLVITSGDGIRTLPGATIKTSLKDFFTSINAVLSVGLGIENGVAVLEKKEYFLRSGLEIMDVGSVVDFNLKPATEYLFSSIKVGYPNNDYEVENGREEYNSTQVYKTPLSRAQAELNLVSVYRADQYGIESVRLERKELNVSETDKKPDNSVFFLHVSKTATLEGFPMIGYENYESVTGISTRTSSYNLGITPKANLMRHGPFLRSFLFGLDGALITFESAEKNSSLVTVDRNGVVIDEGANIRISNLGAPIFAPFKVTFNTKIMRATGSLMEGRASGFIRFNHRGADIMGFVDSTAFNVAFNKSQDFTVLLSPLNNLLTLVH